MSLGTRTGAPRLRSAKRQLGERELDVRLVRSRLCVTPTMSIDSGPSSRARCIPERIEQLNPPVLSPELTGSPTPSGHDRRVADAPACASVTGMQVKWGLSTSNAGRAEKQHPCLRLRALVEHDDTGIVRSHLADRASRINT